MEIFLLNLTWEDFYEKKILFLYPTSIVLNETFSFDILILTAHMVTA